MSDGMGRGKGAIASGTALNAFRTDLHKGSDRF